MHAFNLALETGRNHQNSVTGFIHFHPTEENSNATIPLLENFCFALALLRTKTQESMREGKLLLERLMAFRSEEGTFPVYLHEYGYHHLPYLPFSLLVMFMWIKREFGSILGEELLTLLHSFPLPTLPALTYDTSLPRVIEKAFLYQLEGKDPLFLSSLWEENLMLSLHPAIAWNKGKPELNLIDLWMGEKYGYFPSRFQEKSRDNFSVQMQGALIRPWKEQGIKKEKGSFFYKKLSSYKHVWGTEEDLRYFFLSTDPLVQVQEEEEEELKGSITLSIPSYEKEIEWMPINCLFSKKADSSIGVDEKKATCFFLSSLLCLEDKYLRLHLSFTLHPSTQAPWTGHIQFQSLDKKRKDYGQKEETRAWKIGLRTLSPSSPSMLTISWKIELQRA